MSARSTLAAVMMSPRQTELREVRRLCSPCRTAWQQASRPAHSGRLEEFAPGLPVCCQYFHMQPHAMQRFIDVAPRRWYVQSAREVNHEAVPEGPAADSAFPLALLGVQSPGRPLELTVLNLQT